MNFSLLVIIETRTFSKFRSIRKMVNVYGAQLTIKAHLHCEIWLRLLEHVLIYNELPNYKPWDRQLKAETVSSTFQDLEFDGSL